MTKEKINDYTLRISQANRSEMIVILYDMANQYIEDAILAAEGNDHEALRDNAGKAGRVVSDLIGALDYENELAALLMQCYSFIQSQISLAVIRNRRDELDIAARLLNELGSSFREIAKTDNSKPVMGNSEAIYAGLTYGKSAVYDSLTTEVNRGFTV